MIRRTFLFLITNLAIVLLLSFTMNLLGVTPYLTESGLNPIALLIFASVIGFGGALISLLISKWMAKKSYGIHIIERPNGREEAFLYEVVKELAQRLKMPMPEVGIYDSPEPNAFATGPSRSNALVAVSTGFLRAMDRDEVEGVLGHEMAHVANGDMVTMCLLQGVMNTFVIFFARIAAMIVSNLGRSQEDRGPNPMGGFAYYAISWIFEMIFGFFAMMIVMAFSRYREYRADSLSARLVGKNKMVAALKRLASMQGMKPDPRGKTLEALKISGYGVARLFSSHPPLASRIEALLKSED